MPAERNRKAPKRKQKRDPITEDMRELVAALAQNALDDGFDTTLTLPWRHGKNAVRFGLPLLRGAFLDWVRIQCETQITLIDHRRPLLDYWYFEDAMLTLTGDSQAMSIARGVMRCAQVLSTHNGTGDGTIFNAIWIAALRGASLAPEDIHIRMSAMRDARCWDALGVTPTFRNDKNDFYRRAFLTAWEKRMYHACYALPFVGPRS